ncbi:hypothetical protein B0H14DRAFT_2648426 [Mycena olivaceomarginata]|nr:hypothetical protein B0H14DRAFT_2648426 [Mycena olivaceomarginata]
MYNEKELLALRDPLALSYMDALYAMSAAVQARVEDQSTIKRGKNHTSRHVAFVWSLDAVVVGSYRGDSHPIPPSPRGLKTTWIGNLSEEGSRKRNLSRSLQQSEQRIELGPRKH